MMKYYVSTTLLVRKEEAMTTGDTSKIELVWMKTIDKNGKVSLIEGPAISIMKGSVKALWENLVINMS